MRGFEKWSKRSYWIWLRSQCTSCLRFQRTFQPLPDSLVSDFSNHFCCPQVFSLVPCCCCTSSTQRSSFSHRWACFCRTDRIPKRCPENPCSKRWLWFWIFIGQQYPTFAIWWGYLRARWFWFWNRLQWLEGKLRERHYPRISKVGWTCLRWSFLWVALWRRSRIRWSWWTLRFSCSNRNIIVFLCKLSVLNRKG